MENINYRVIRVKDIQNLLGVSFSTASNYYQDIKKQYDVRIVTTYHFNKYLCVL